jgi:hypothetical protein
MCMCCVVAPSPGHAPLSALVGSQTSSRGPFCALISALISALICRVCAGLSPRLRRQAHCHGGEGWGHARQAWAGADGEMWFANVLSWPILRPDFCPDFCPDLSCLRRSKPEMIWDSGWRKGGHRRAGLGGRSGGYSHHVFHFLVLFAVQCRVLR